jgi:hypothetical protein
MRKFKFLLQLRLFDVDAFALSCDNKENDETASQVPCQVFQTIIYE